MENQEVEFNKTFIRVMLLYKKKKKKKAYTSVNIPSLMDVKNS